MAAWSLPLTVWGVSSIGAGAPKLKSLVDSSISTVRRGAVLCVLSELVLVMIVRVWLAIIAIFVFGRGWLGFLRELESLFCKFLLVIITYL